MANLEKTVKAIVILQHFFFWGGEEERGTGGVNYSGVIIKRDTEECFNRVSLMVLTRIVTY